MFTKRVHPSIYRIDAPYEGGGVVYLYLLKGDRVALVDSGTVSIAQQVLPAALAEIGMSLSDVDVLLNTHGHLDHAGGNRRVKDASATTIYIHPADEAMACNLEEEISFHCKPMVALDFPRSAVEQRREFVSITAGATKAEVDVRITDGEVVDLGKGITLRAIHVPGHTPGHLVYYWDSEGVLLTGDAIQGQGFQPGGFPYYFDATNYRNSLSKMLELDLRMLGLGHTFIGGSAINAPTRFGDECRTLIQESMRVSDAISAAVEQAVRRLPGASKREIALAALDELLYSVPQVRLRETGMPGSAGPAMLSHIEAVLGEGC